jgi:GxxExxY protein
VVESSLIIELKAADRILPIHSAQIMTYMRLLQVSAGLLMNFNAPTLPKGIKRILT